MPQSHPPYSRVFGVDHLVCKGHVTFAAADEGDIYYNGATTADYPGFIATATEMEVVSDQAADAVGSTGALEVTVTGLDADYALVKEEFAMAGATAVAGTVEFLRVLKAEVSDVGTGEVNAGNIQVREVDNVPVMAYIPAGEGRSQDCVLTVPAGYTLYVAHWQMSINALTTMESYYMTRKYDAGGWRRHTGYAYLGGQQSHEAISPFWHPKVTEKADVRLRVAVGAAAKVAGYVAGILVAN